MPPQARLAYGAFMVLAMAVFLLARRWTPQPPGIVALPRKHKLALLFAVLVGGMFGAKLPFVFQAESGPFTLTAWAADGKTLTTGLLGAYLAVELTKLLLGICQKTGDAFALPLALALAVGRWGCFCNGCCAGIPTDLPWGVDFGDGLYRHPTQVYESLFHGCMAGLLLWLTLAERLRYQRLKLYLICYGIFRFGMEFLRPEPANLAGLTFYQWVCVVLIGGMVAQWCYDARITTPTNTAPHSVPRIS